MNKKVTKYTNEMIFNRINGDVCAVAKGKDNTYSLAIISNYGKEGTYAQQTPHYDSLDELFQNEHEDGEVELEGEVSITYK